MGCGEGENGAESAAFSLGMVKVEHAAHYVREDDECDLPLSIQGTLAELRRCDFSRFPMRTRLRFSAAMAHGFPAMVRVWVTCWVVDREDPEGKRVVMTEFYELVLHDQVVARIGAVEWLRSVLRRVLEHELDECLFFAGSRYRDPHAGGSTAF